MTNFSGFSKVSSFGSPVSYPGLLLGDKYLSPYCSDNFEDVCQPEKFLARLKGT